MTWLEDEDIVRCPQCGQPAEENLFFADDDLEQEHPFCECGYEWQVAEDVRIIEDGNYE